MKETIRARSSLGPGELRRRINPRTLPSPQAYGKHRTHIIGQDRAIRALELGLRLESPGYNVFLSGPSGSGRMSTAKHILAAFKEPRKPLRDFVYAHNFREPDRARMLVLAPGEGLRLRKAMERLVTGLKSKLPRALGLEACQRERDRLAAEYQKREGEVYAAFQRRLRDQDFVLVEVGEGPAAEQDILPLIDGKPETLHGLEGKISVRRLRGLERKRHKFRLEREQVQRKARQLAREMAAVLEDFDLRIGSAVIDNLIEEVSEDFRAPEVLEYLAEVREALRDRIPDLVRTESAQARGENTHEPPGPDPLAPFQVNIILSNARREGCPIVIEHNPSVVRLFGTIERARDESSPPEAEFTNIRAGALLRADGGFLVVNAEDLLNEPGAWMALKRTLSSGLLDVRTPEGPGAPSISALKPDPIPVDVKVILLGDEDVYRTLYLAEDDFKKTFKVKAEFDVEMQFTPTNLEKFLAFVARVVGEERLLAPTRPAVALLVEEAMRDIEHQGKISTRFRVIADLLRESTYWARAAHRNQIAAGDVERAIRERLGRINLAEEKYREDIERDLIMVSTRGRRVGQINGLTVFDFGDYSFGKPCRITASCGVGRVGILNIERECGLSGESHDKGVLIIGGFLRSRLGRRRPLALETSICFEQSYGPIDGDSASSSEVYAILSSLADVPIDQGIAVTGSVNQHGDIQPIGGVNQKIEGFFEICQERGLDGKQGVMIPRRNLDNLMLRPDVVDAVRKGRFSIWAISTIEEGLELLTGMPAGAPDPNGHYPPQTIYGRASERLDQMAEAMKGLT